MSCARSDELKSGANAERGVTERQGGGRGSGCLTLIVTSWSTKYCPAVTLTLFQITLYILTCSGRHYHRNGPRVPL